jgi:hypothetical protein
MFRWSRRTNKAMACLIFLRFFADQEDILMHIDKPSIDPTDPEYGVECEEALAPLLRQSLMQQLQPDGMPAL